MILLLLLTLLLTPNIRAQTHSPRPVPFAVRSPYLTIWNHIWANENRSLLYGQTTFNVSMGFNWLALVRVDGVTYSFVDYGSQFFNDTVNLTNVVVTPTQTIVSAQAGPMQVNLTFLSPIEPGDWVKQSIPFSYVAFTARSLDGTSHAVQVYSHIGGQWHSGLSDANLTFFGGVTSYAGVIYHSVTVSPQAEFTEVADQAVWGTLYYAMQTGNNVTYTIASDPDSRNQFVRNGTLDNLGGSPASSLAFFMNNTEVLAMSRDLGAIQSTQAPVVWTVGYTTDPAVNYTDLSGAPPRRRFLYYTTQYNSDGDLIVDFLDDFTNASSRAQQLDHRILQNATSVSNMLGDLTSLAIAQVYGSTQLTVGLDASGNLNSSDVMMFMKNIGGVPESRVNPVEVLYSAFPAFMYIDPSLGAPLLEPLLRLQASPNYTISFAAADLGSSYPNISGSNSNHNQGVEQSGNMLIMTYAYARASGDGSLISRYYPLLTSWANYLISSALYIHNQSSADGLTVSNQTNLAIKGIIAVEAMSKMSSVVNQTGDASKYSSAATSMYSQWKSLALSGDLHLLAAYGQAGSWSLGYNLFADVWLGTNLVESSVYDGQSSFIDNMILTNKSTLSNNYGMPIDTVFPGTNVAFSSWNLFAAAMTTNEDLRSQLISKIHNWASYNTNGSAGLAGDVFPVNYYNDFGSTIGGVASPAQGAMFAPLALKAPVLLNIPTTTTTKTTSSQTKSNIPAIAGGVIGGVAAILSVIGIFIFVRRRRRQGTPNSTTSSNSVQVITTPYNPIASEATLPVNRLAETLVEQFPLSQPVAPVPAGLSAKEIARLRAQTLSPQPSHGPSTSDVSQSTPSPPNAVNESGGETSPYDVRRLVHSEVEAQVRREMERLRGEGLVTVPGAPPSYTEGDGQQFTGS